MPTFPMMQVDAFTTRPLAGNPCAIIFDADELDTPTMQSIAREMNLSETAFVLKSNVADVRARYFTPAEEIPLAGHPTIATFHALLESGRLPFAGDQQTYRLELNVGPIRIDVRRLTGNRIEVVMTQKRPEFLNIMDPAQVMPVFGLTEADLIENVPIQVVSTGTPQLMIPLRDHSALRSASPRMERYGALREAGGFFSPHLFCVEGFTEEGQTSARHFGTPPDLFEDPFTGSATGGMSAYIWRYNLIENPQFVAEQGYWMGRPGQANVTIAGEREEIEAIQVAGSAVTVLQGSLSI